MILETTFGYLISDCNNNRWVNQKKGESVLTGCKLSSILSTNSSRKPVRCSHQDLVSSRILYWKAWNDSFLAQRLLFGVDIYQLLT